MQALIFDCDGTLADTMPAHYRAWQTVLAPLSLQFPERRFYALAGVPTPRIAELLVGESGRRDLDPLALADLKERTYAESVDRVAPIDKVVAVARAARGRLPLAVASGSHRSLVEATLAAIGTTGWWQAVVTAEDVLHPKPAPDIFLEAARRLGVAPELCTVYEDGDLGLEAARRAGMTAVDIRLLP